MAKGRVAARGFDIFHEGVHQTFSAGERVPEEIVELVKNPKIWEPRQKDLDDVQKVLASNNVLTDEYIKEFAGRTPAGAEAISSSEDDEDDEVLDDLGDLTVAQLKEYASENEIDLGDASKKAEILSVLRSQE